MAQLHRTLSRHVSGPDRDLVREQTGVLQAQIEGILLGAIPVLRVNVELVHVDDEWQGADE